MQFKGMTLNKRFSVPNKSYRDSFCFTYLMCSYSWHFDTEIVPCHATRARAFTFLPEIDNIFIESKDDILLSRKHIFFC